MDYHCHSVQCPNFLDICLCYPVMLPQCLFICKTLVDLRLGNCVGISSSGTISLPSLKKLHIRCVDEVLSHLISGCPVLEDLIIDGIRIQYFGGCYNISSPTIKTLRVNFGYDCYNNIDYMMEINAPALRYLQVDNCSYEHITISPITMASLIEADIRLNDHLRSDEDSPFRLNDHFSSDEDSPYASYVIKFLDCLCNVKCLKLSGLYNEKFLDTTVAGSIVKFDNLTKLKLQLAFDWHFLVKFLEIADNLEVLIISEDSYVTYWKKPKQVPICLLSRLRTIRIGYGILMLCTEHEFNMVRYLLRNGKVLERMEIFPPDNETYFKEKLSDTLKRISLFERGSKACQLGFY